MKQLQDKETLMLNPNDLFTHQNIVFDKIIKKIKKGITLEDNIPAIIVGRMSGSKDESNGKYVVKEGNHRAYANLKLGKLVEAEFCSEFQPKSIYLQKVNELFLDYTDELAKNHMENKFYRE